MLMTILVAASRVRGRRTIIGVRIVCRWAERSWRQVRRTPILSAGYAFGGKLLRSFSTA